MTVSGARDERTFRRLFERLARWKVCLFCSNSYGVSPLVLAVGSHYQGKGETVALERNNGQQRHWTAALRRRSIVFEVARDDRTPRRSIRPPARQQGAAPEMYRLPIQTGEILTLAKNAILAR